MSREGEKDRGCQAGSDYTASKACERAGGADYFPERLADEIIGLPRASLASSREILLWASMVKQRSERWRCYAKAN
jgi:hypothetical protein